MNLGNRDILVSSMGLEHIEFYEQFEDDGEYLRFLFMADFKADSHRRGDSAVAVGLHNRFLRPGSSPSGGLAIPLSPRLMSIPAASLGI